MKASGQGSRPLVCVIWVNGKVRMLAHSINCHVLKLRSKRGSFISSAKKQRVKVEEMETGLRYTP